MTQQNTGGSSAGGIGAALRPVLEDLAGSRGYTLEALAAETRRRGYAYLPGEIATGERGGFGSAIDDVLCLDDCERGRVVTALVEGMSGRLLPLVTSRPHRTPQGSGATRRRRRSARTPRFAWSPTRTPGGLRGAGRRGGVGP